jgi:hypothetical protein
MELGDDRRLYVMAFDHRGSFERQLVGLTRAPSSAEAARIADAKAVIHEGFRLALDAGLDRPAASSPSPGRGSTRLAGDRGAHRPRLVRFGAATRRPADSDVPLRYDPSRGRIYYHRVVDGRDAAGSAEPRAPAG